MAVKYTQSVYAAFLGSRMSVKGRRQLFSQPKHKMQFPLVPPDAPQPKAEGGEAEPNVLNSRIENGT